MKEVAQTYLGNLNNDVNLLDIAVESCLELQLKAEDCYKGRIYGHTKNGIEIGIIKDRDRPLRSGDLFRTNSNKIVRIELKEEELLVLNLSQLEPNVSQVKLVQLGQILGNNHYPIEVRDRQILVKLTTGKRVIEQLINNLHISGLKISYKYMSDDAIVWTKHSH